MSNVTTPPEVYQLHVWLREISPMISRRLLVRSDSTIADLHSILQIIMGWEGYHLHQFIIRGKCWPRAVLFKALKDCNKHPIEGTRGERIEQVAHLIVTGNLGNAKQGAGVIGLPVVL